MYCWRIGQNTWCRGTNALSTGLNSSVSRLQLERREAATEEMKWGLPRKWASQGLLVSLSISLAFLHTAFRLRLIFTHLSGGQDCPSVENISICWIKSSRNPSVSHQLPDDPKRCFPSCFWRPVSSFPDVNPNSPSSPLRARLQRREQQKRF